MPQRTRAVLLTVFGLLAAVLPAGRAAAAPTRATPCVTTLWKAGTGGYRTYRIPAVVTVRGTLVAFAEGRVHSSADNGDIDVVERRSADGGCTWTPQQVVAEDGTDTVGNPTPVVAADGTLVLLTNRQAGQTTQGQIQSDQVPAADSRRAFVQTSADAGATWSARREITASVKRPGWLWFATGPGHGLTLTRGRAAGRLVVAANHSEADGRSGVDLLLSDDDGRTWRLGASENDTDATLRPNETSAAQLPDGEIYLSARNNGGGTGMNRASAYSATAGRTYTTPLRPLPGLVGPSVQGGVLQDPGLPAGLPCAPLLYSGPADPDSRRHLTLRRSDDYGRTWHTLTDLTAPITPAAYSDLTGIARGELGTVFETGADSPYEEIAWRRVSLRCP
ncbi:sialidase family protein [Actinacidiphila sp. ITFR-21]|uniref:sialidase family protein n=1 Tax=Actinacidiphila sp. ITFR-21 TaxID=3075199 RepID=UPI00288AA168|nr:sialidase family protein [Streptomyces sp. ITFR-21]WNI15383.1 sialidase family protein [Streptomyces sp. ITFR-21]